MVLDLQTARGGGGGQPKLAPELLAAALTSLTSLGRASGQFSVMARILDPGKVLARPGVHFGFAVEEATGRIIPPSGGPPVANGRVLAAMRIDLPGDDATDLPGDDAAVLQRRIGALRDTLLALSADGWAIQAEKLAQAELLRSLGEMAARPEDLAGVAGLPPGIDGSGVLVGVVDFGCDFAHPAFREAGPGATRLRMLWDQNGPTPPGQPVPGRIIGAAEIDAALAAPDPYAALDYRPWENGYGKADAARRMQVHGTHVLGIAAGRHPGPAMGLVLGAGVAPGASLGFVHLRPRALISDGDATDVLDGVCQLFEAAHEAGLGCVVNLSLGANSGGHDGMGLLDRALDALLQVPGRAIVVAAGNNQLAGIALRGSLSAPAPARFGWRFQAVDSSANILRIYAEHGAVAPPVVSLARPGGQRALPDNAMSDGAALIVDDQGRIDGVYSFMLYAPSTDAPLALHEIRLLPSGKREVWQVEVTSQAEDGTASDFVAWIQRDDVSAFDVSRFEPMPAGAAIGCTLGSLACAERPVCVGAWDRARAAPAAFSSRGPTRVGVEKPDVVAPGTNITGPAARGGQRSVQPNARPGVLGPLFPAGFRADGTSAAAPHVAGVIALMLQARPRLKADRIRAILRATTRERQANPAAAWDPGLGCGRADAGAALAMTLLEPP